MDEQILPAQKRQVPGLVPLTEEDYAAEADLRLEREVNEGGFTDSVQRAFRSGDNFGYQIIKRLEREKNAPAPEAGYSPEKFIERNEQYIPGEHIKSFMHTRSTEEANMVLRDMRESLHDRDVLSRRHAVSTFVASGLVGMFDVDTPIAIFSGGLGLAAKSSRWLRAGRGALAGGTSQAALATASTEASTVGDWAMIPAAGLGGMGFGMIGGMMSKGVSKAPEFRANEAMEAARREFSDTLDEGAPLAARDIRNENFTSPDTYGSLRAEAEELALKEAPAADGTAAPRAFSLDDVDDAIPDSTGDRLTGQGASVGASQLNPQGNVANIVDAKSAQMVQDAQAALRQSGVARDFYDDNGQIAYKGAVGDKVSTAARRFQDAVSASPIASDFNKLWRSGSAVAQQLAYDTMENAAGIVRNNRSASMLKDLYEKRLTGAFLPEYQDAFGSWARANGTTRWSQIFDAQVRERFNREIMGELNARAFGGPRSLNPDIKRAADAHDKWSELDVEIGAGRPGEHSIKGYEKLKAYSGYVSQKWSGSRINKLVQSGKHTIDDITKAVAEGYVAKHGVSPKDAAAWAKAVTRRAMASERGSDMNLVGILQQDGRPFLEEMLRNAGHDPKEVKRLMDRLEGAAAQRGQAGHTKGRIDIDLRFTASNGVAIMDLVDTDVARMVSRRARGTSGAAALARKGIRSRADRENIKNAILHEQQARGQSQPTGNRVSDAIDGDKHLTPEDIDDMFSYFDAGPIGGGVGPTVSRIKKLTNLALLNQLGLTQMAEVGVQVASVGYSRWIKHAGEQFQTALNKQDSPLNVELKHMNVMVAEERLFRDDFAIEMDRVGTPATEFGQKFDHMLNAGQRVQGYMSGFYMARKFQQRVAVSSAADKIMTNMKGLANDLSDVRAADLGLDPKTFARIKTYVDNGTVEFRDGSVYKLNIDKWDAETAEDFALSLNRHVYQVVQKAMIGESTVLFHKDGLASLFFHLKSFPMLAMEKQAYRNLRIADPEAQWAFMLGLATAGAAYTTRQVMSGNGSDLSVDKIARGAIGLSNMAGWIPMWTDPVAGMLGMDSLKFNAYNQGITENVVSTPAALPTINRMLNIPGAVGNILTGDMTNSDIRALQATPIIGNLYGFTAMFNALKE